MFDNLPRNYFGAIYADPPWAFRVWGENGDSRNGLAKAHYNTIDVAQLKTFPVLSLAKEDCSLFIWITWPNLLEAVDLIDAWGFKYKTCAFSWMKADVSNLNLFSDPVDAYMGLGYWTRANSEVCLLGTRGSPKRLHADVRQGIIEPRREHSRKPDCVPNRIERLVAGPYLELFARTVRPGWSCWGNQTDKFLPQPKEAAD